MRQHFALFCAPAEMPDQRHKSRERGTGEGIQVDCLTTFPLKHFSISTEITVNRCRKCIVTVIGLSFSIAPIFNLLVTVSQGHVSTSARACAECGARNFDSSPFLRRQPEQGNGGTLGAGSRSRLSLAGRLIS
jgi:hypothetical protein